MTRLAAALRAEAARRGLSQSEVARRAGIRQAAVSMVFAGRRQPTAATLSAILGAMGLPWGWLDGQGLRPAGS